MNSLPVDNNRLLKGRVNYALKIGIDLKAVKGREKFLMNGRFG